MLSRYVGTALAISVLALVPARAQTVVGSADTAQPASALDIPIEKIADTTDGCAILDKDFPGLRTHPMYSFFKPMTLNQIAAMSGGKITPDMLAQAQTDLAAAPLAPVAVSVSAAGAP